MLHDRSTSCAERSRPVRALALVRALRALVNSRAGAARAESIPRRSCGTRSVAVARELRAHSERLGLEADRVQAHRAHTSRARMAVPIEPSRAGEWPRQRKHQGGVMAHLPATTFGIAAPTSYAPWGPFLAAGQPIGVQPQLFG